MPGDSGTRPGCGYAFASFADERRTNMGHAENAQLETADASRLIQASGPARRAPVQRLAARAVAAAVVGVVRLQTPKTFADG